jgi:hypothetical protein
VSGNTEYDLYAYVRGEIDAEDSHGKWIVRARFYDGSGGSLGYENAAAGAAGTLDGTWQQQGGRITTPADAATVRILVDGAQHDILDGLDRLVIMFDGADAAAVSSARQKWKQVTAVAGVTATYWQQDERGRWVKKATAGEGAANSDQ